MRTASGDCFFPYLRAIYTSNAVQEKSNEELERILSRVEELGDAYGDNGQALADHMGEALLVFGGLANQGFTEDHLDHIINY
ncbi:hypothetical protein ACFSC6_10365 [Rufibacter sediminis]